MLIPRAGLGVKALARLPSGARAHTLERGSQMTALGATLVFASPTWPRLMLAAAGVAFAWEAVAAFLWARRGRAPGAAIAAMLGGPLVAAVAVVYGGMDTPRGGPTRARWLLTAGLRGTLLWALAAAILFLHSGQAAGLPDGAVLALAACALIWCVRSYRRTTAPLSRRQKATLLLIRCAVIVLLAAWASGPALAYRRAVSVRRTVLVGIDTSASMQRRDASSPAGTLTRIAAVARALDDHADELDRLARRADVEVFAFAAASAPIATLSPATGTRLALPPATGAVTAAGDAAQEMVEAVARDGRDVAAVILVSDGCNNAAQRVGPEAFAALMASRGAAVSTVGAGSSAATADTRSLSVKALSSQDQVEAFHRLPISATVKSLGLAGRTVQVTCRFGGEVVGAETLAITGDQTAHNVRFLHTPRRSGFHRLVVTAECANGPPEGLIGEPDAGKLVHVIDREMRVLYVEGKIRYESKFIARALSAGGRFGLDRRILLGPPVAGAPGRLGEKLEDWLIYHAVIFGNVAADALSRRQLEIVRKIVGEYGKGFCMIGGRESFADGGWAETPLAEMLPVEIGRARGQIATPLKVVPTAAGRESDVMRIGGPGQSVADAWASLAPLPGASRLGAPKTAATVLAASPIGTPLIVSQRYGKGRSMAVALDTTYRWVLTPRPTADLQKRFWRQVALHLCAPKGNAWIATDKTRYDLRRVREGAERVEITAGVEDPRGLPLPKAPVRVTLTTPGGKALPLSLPPDAAIRRKRLGRSLIHEPGIYGLRLEARVGEKALTAEHKFQVARRDVEALEPLANFDLLRRVAAAGGGQFVPLRGLGQLLRHIHVAATPKTHTRTETRDLADAARWPIVLALIVLLCVEWALRKRKGLV